MSLPSDCSHSMNEHDVSFTNSQGLFEYFSHPRFPVEIQDMIWHEAISVFATRGKIVELNACVSDTLAGPDGEIMDVSYGFVAARPVCPMLHTCSRSRELAMKKWDLTFPTTYKTDRRLVSANKLPSPLEKIPRVWFDFDNEILLFLEVSSDLDHPVMLDYFKSQVDLETRRRVKNVASTINILTDSCAPWAVAQSLAPSILAMHLFNIFPGLKALYLMRDEGLDAYELGLELEPCPEIRDSVEESPQVDEWRKEFTKWKDGGEFVCEFLVPFWGSEEKRMSQE